MKLHQPINHREGFSLIELLVVIGFIAVLVALTASATFRIVGVQEEKTTQQNLIKLQALLDQHWKAVIEKANKDTTIPQFTEELAGKIAGTPNWEKRARVLHVKLSLRQHFPIAVPELSAAPPGYPYPAGYSAAVGAGLALDQMSSALLYLALRQARSGVDTNADAMLNSMESLPTQSPDPMT